MRIAAAAVIVLLSASVAAASGAGDGLLQLWTQLLLWIQSEQRALHAELAATLRTLSEDGGAGAAWALISASFVYGVLHAAGPGHGKAILTTYLATQPENLRRGVSLAAAAAFCQGVVAIVLVYGLVLAVGLLPRDASVAAGWSERASFALVAGIGALLALRALRHLLSRRRAAVHEHGHGHEHAHHHEHHDHHHADCGCGHRHAPSGEQLRAASGLRATIGVVLSIGLRPCSGALVVLVLASALGLHWAGVGAVAAMSLGTAIAVAALAMLAVGARNRAQRLASARGGIWSLSMHGVALAGGLLLVALGGSLLAASFAPVHPLGL